MPPLVAPLKHKVCEAAVLERISVKVMFWTKAWTQLQCSHDKTKLRSLNYKEYVKKYELRASDTFEKLFVDYCKRMSLSLEHIQFEYDGILLTRFTTPNRLRMNNPMQKYLIEAFSRLDVDEIKRMRRDFEKREEEASNTMINASDEGSRLVAEADIEDQDLFSLTVRDKVGYGTIIQCKKVDITAFVIVETLLATNMDNFNTNLVE